MKKIEEMTKFESVPTGERNQLSRLSAAAHRRAVPDGGDLARAGTVEDLLVAEIDLSAIGRVRAQYDYLADRRAGLDVNEARRESA